MPELPEVQTTVDGLNLRLKNLTITDIWSSYNSASHAGKDNIKNVLYFKNFRAVVSGAKFLKAERRGKNILIDLSNQHTVLIHMKMTGHLLYGSYNLHKDGGKEIWRPDKNAANEALHDPFNQHLRLVFSLSDGKQLAFSDMRKFAKVFVVPTSEKYTLPDIAELGPDALAKNFTFEKFCEQILKRPNTAIKQVLLDQSLMSGIGNIYSDEMLWAAGIHPLSTPAAIPKNSANQSMNHSLKSLYKEMRIVLERGLHFGGDSESDYRNIDGVPGEFQNKHHAYRHTGEVCAKRGCGGIIQRLKIGGRSAHFCSKHQTRFTSNKKK